MACSHIGNISFLKSMYSWASYPCYKSHRWANSLIKGARAPIFSRGLRGAGATIIMPLNSIVVPRNIIIMLLNIILMPLHIIIMPLPSIIMPHNIIVPLTSACSTCQREKVWAVVNPQLVPMHKHRNTLCGKFYYIQALLNCLL